MENKLIVHRVSAKFKFWVRRTFALVEIGSSQLIYNKKKIDHSFHTKICMRKSLTATMLWAILVEIKHGPRSIYLYFFIKYKIVFI
jgi:hypothetical protein